MKPYHSRPHTFGLKALRVFAVGWLALGVVAANAAPQPGKPAPDFTAIDSNGRSHNLADYRGKTVVLEWTNHLCPYTVKHYRSGNIQALQRRAAADGVIWLSVISSAPGKQGHVSAEEANSLTDERKAAPAAVLLDPKGTLGRLFDARTTPHMFIVDKDGTLAYMGAIDDRPSADTADIQGATNYVSEALAALAAGRKVASSSTLPYGCSVKYGAPPS
jgi:hypothetical protein